MGARGFNDSVLLLLVLFLRTVSCCLVGWARKGKERQARIKRFPRRYILHAFRAQTDKDYIGDILLQ